MSRRTTTKFPTVNSHMGGLYITSPGVLQHTSSRRVVTTLLQDADSRRCFTTLFQDATSRRSCKVHIHDAPARYSFTTLLHDTFRRHYFTTLLQSTYSRHDFKILIHDETSRRFLSRDIFFFRNDVSHVCHDASSGRMMVTLTSSRQIFTILIRTIIYAGQSGRFFRTL